MHRRWSIHLICWLQLVAPVAVWAQTAAPAPALTSGPSAGDADAPAQAPTDTGDESSRSLFEPALRQFSFGGRLTSVSGDPARFQRYQDLRDGVLFTDARYTREDPGGSWLFKATADNVGWRDQRYSADYERTGRFVISGLWDEIPQFYSIDTRTPFTSSGGDLVLDNAAQRAVQTGQTDRSVYVPLAPQFDLKERRDIGQVSFLATPNQQFDIKATFTTNRHVGELPWGASFGFSNDVEVALPYDSRTNDFTVGAEWTNGRNMLRVAYDGSWFDNLDPVLLWDSPLSLDDTTSAPGRGRMTLWPSNSAQTVSVAGYSKFARRTQVTGLFSFGVQTNDEPLQPFTINPTLTQLTLPRATADAQANVFNTNISLVSRPATGWRFSTRLRRYDYNNETTHAAIPQFINYDTSVTTSTTGGPELYAHDRTNFDADATYTGLGPVAVTGGYAYNRGGYAFRIFDNTGENAVFVSADAVGSQWVTFRARYDHSERTGSGLNEDLLLEIGEQPGLRHYDVADRSRNQFTGQVDVVPNELWMFSASAGVGKDEYDDSDFGLQESTFRVLSFGVDYRQPSGLGAGASYNYERYAGLQRSRQANPGQEDDPLRDWTADSTERVDYFSIYITPPKIGRRTEARLSYDYSYAKGSYLYGIVPGGPLTPPNQLPDVYNKLQQLHVDVRHRLSGRLAASFSYLYEPFRVYDFAFDQTVVNSIVQPSSLVLGYVYRPYTAHSAVLSLRYFWP